MLFRTLNAMLFLSGNCLAGDAWDDFANNLATDLAPVLQLFGEQVTKQFLSESTSVIDSLIFALAPLGVLTAVVSAIRVCGSPTLRAFIGRAQEGRGEAEAELCSSTSEDICEMYQNGAIRRVFGQPKLLEIIHNPNEESFYELETGHSFPTAGIYTFAEYRKTGRGKREWKERESTINTWKKRFLKRSSGPTVEDGVKPTSESDQFAPNPNLMLNIGIKRAPPYMLSAVVIFGTILQSSIIAFAVFATLRLGLKKDGKAPATWKLHLMVLGSVLMCSGMFLCSHIVDRSTKERTFERSKVETSDGSERPSAMHWVQVGGQVIGDHTFESFVYNGDGTSLQSYVSSRRRPRSQQDSLLTWIGAFSTITGFIFQFVGLRGLHASVSMLQMGATLMMSILRALLRSRRLGDDANAAQRDETGSNLQGSELDWLAWKLCTDGIIGSDSIGSTGRPIWTVHQPATCTTKYAAEARDLQHSHDLEESSGDSLPNCTSASSLEVSENHFHALIIDSMSDRGCKTNYLVRENNGDTQLYHAKPPDLTVKLWHYRVRLARMTSISPEPSPLQIWPDSLVSGRRAAITLYKTLSHCAGLILSQCEDLLSRERIYVRFDCASDLLKPNKKGGGKFDMQSSPFRFENRHDRHDRYVYFSFQDEKSAEFRPRKFVPDLAQLEAAISLATWKMDAQDGAAACKIRRRRILIAMENDSIGSCPWWKASRTFKDLGNISMAKNWGKGILDFSTTSTTNSPGGMTLLHSSPAQLWREMEDYSNENIIPEYIRPKYTRTSVSLPDTHYDKPYYRIFGWDVLSKDMMKWSHCYVRFSQPVAEESDSSSQVLYAQELFVGFLKAMLTTSWRPLGYSTYIYGDKRNEKHQIENSSIEGLVRAFVENDLGSRSVAHHCIFSAIIASKCMSPIIDGIEGAYLSSLRHIREKDFERAQDVLEWTLSAWPADTNDVVYDALRRKCFVRLAVLLTYRCGQTDPSTDAKGFLSLQMKLKDLGVLATQSQEWSPNSTSCNIELIIRLIMEIIRLHSMDLQETFCKHQCRTILHSWLPNSGYEEEIVIRFMQRPSYSSRSKLLAITENDPVAILVRGIDSLITPNEDDTVDELGRDILSLLLSCHGTLWHWVIEIYLEDQPSPLSKDKSGRNAISWAFSEGDIRTVKQIFDTRLHFALPLDFGEVANPILERDNENWMPFHHAISSNRLDVLSYLHSKHPEAFPVHWADNSTWIAASCPGVEDETLRFLTSCVYKPSLEQLERIAQFDGISDRTLKFLVRGVIERSDHSIEWFVYRCVRCSFFFTVKNVLKHDASALFKFQTLCQDHQSLRESLLMTLYGEEKVQMMQLLLEMILPLYKNRESLARVLEVIGENPGLEILKLVRKREEELLDEAD